MERPSKGSEPSTACRPPLIGIKPCPDCRNQLGLFFTHETNIMVQVLPSRLDDGPNLTATRRGAGGLHPTLLRLLER